MDEKLNSKELAIEVKLLREEVLSLTQSKNELLAYKQQLDAIMDHAPVAVNLKDREGRYIRVNKQIETLFGVKHEDIVGMLPATAINPRMAAASREHDLTVLHFGKANTRELVVESNTKDQPRIWLATKFPVFNGDGEIDGLGTIGIDITQRRLDSEKLLKSNDLFCKTEQLSKVGHWEWDEIASRYINCSEQYASFFGLTVEQVLETITSTEVDLALVCEEDRERYKQTTDAVREHKQGYEIEYRGVNKAGLLVHLREIGEPVLDDNGVVIKTVGMIQDITTAKEKELALLQAIEEASEARAAILTKSQFLAA
ncbi:MAG: PAS domain-containing protein, partial [Pseudomonadales bacterium]